MSPPAAMLLRMSSHPVSQYGPPAGHPQHPVAPFGPPAGQPARFPGQGELVLHLRKPPGLGSAAMISPVVTIDGYPAPARWEANSYPVPPGVRTICVESQSSGGTDASSWRSR